MSKDVDFDFASGTDFEKLLIKELWRITGRKKDFCKPDIYDVDKNIFYEAKFTRPFYDKPPDRNPEAVDIGTGLVKNQFDRYVKIVESGNARVRIVHKMKEGIFKNRIFVSWLDEKLISKARLSPNKKTVYFLYEDLEFDDYLKI